MRPKILIGNRLQGGEKRTGSLISCAWIASIAFSNSRAADTFRLFYGLTNSLDHSSIHTTSGDAFVVLVPVSNAGQMICGTPLYAIFFRDHFCHIEFCVRRRIYKTMNEENRIKFAHQSGMRCILTRPRRPVSSIMSHLDDLFNGIDRAQRVSCVSNRDETPARSNAFQS